MTSFSSLVPAFLEEIPRDPWGDEPFRVRRDGEWLELSSQLKVGREPLPLSLRLTREQR